MARLTVLSIAYPFSRVSVDAVGGAEQVLGTLDAALVAAGHRSLVIAREGSQTAGALVPIRGSGGVLDGPAVGRVHAQVIEATTRVLAEEHVDVVHTHGLDVDRYLPLSGPPALVTLHLPPSWYARDALWAVRPNMHLCCVSKSQRAALPSWASRADVIENGVRIEELLPRATKGRFCLVLARICPEKGIDEALDAADEAGVPLVIAGDVSSWPAHQEYFAKFIADRLRPPHRWIGPVGLARKRRLLAAARALLVPSRAPETSSLVAMEALASGTPVIAYASGALPDIVEHGVTGYVVDGPHAMAKAIADAASIAPDACRHAAVTRFSAERMASSYIAKYEELARTTRTGRTLRPEAPLVVEEVRGARALGALEPEWSALWRRSPVASPFQSSGWLLAYSDAFCGAHTNAEPWAIAVRKAGKLVGLAPLCTRTRDGARTITLLGDGVSDYLDVVSDPELSAQCAAAVIETLRQQCTEDSTVILDELRECSPLLPSPPSAPPESEPDETFRRSRCPTLRLAAGVDPIPRAMREKVRYYERRAERRGRVEVCEVAGDACAEWLETLFALHRARWSARGEEGVLGDPDVQSFQRTAVGALAKEGLCRMYGLRIGEQRAAAMLVLRDAWAAYYYIGGFDPELAAVSPGTILIANVVDRALADGLAELHFLRGGETYKYRFGARDRFNHARVLKPLPPASRRTPLPPPHATARRSIRTEAARSGAFPGAPRM